MHPASPAPLQVGFGKVDVTPPLAIPYLSFYPRQTPFEGVHDWLFARALAAEVPGTSPPAAPPPLHGVERGLGGEVNGDTECMAIVAVDALGFSRSILGSGRNFIGEVRARVPQRTGIPAANVLVAATHAHSTPQTTDIAPLVEQFPAAAAWLERLIDQLAAAVQVAWASRAPAEVRGATGLAPGIAWCRRIITRDGRIVRLQDRPPDDHVVKEPRDDRVPVLLVTRAAAGVQAEATAPRHKPVSGSLVAHGRGPRSPFPPREGGQGVRSPPAPLGAVIGFTCHPTTVQVQPLVSADYPGVACDLVERELPAGTCLFLQGACGNVGPVRATTDFADVALYGRALGGEALRVLALLAARDVPPMRAALATGSEVVELERRPLPDRVPLEREAAGLEARIRQATTSEARREAVAAYRRVAEPLRLAQLGAGPVRVEVQAIRLGDALIVGCEGELFVEYGNRLKQASPAAITFVAAYSNGYEGYIPTPETFDEGGYEASLGPWTRVWRTGGDVLTERAMTLAQRVWQQAE